MDCAVLNALQNILRTMPCETRYEHYGLCDVNRVTKHFTDYAVLNALQSIVDCAVLNALQNIIDCAV